jgi:hypothetical protein
VLGAMTAGLAVPAARPGRVARAGTTNRCALVTTEATIISLRVSVPVLSVQITETEPSVSIAGRRRTMALRLRHGLHADRQRDGQHRRQALGNRGDRQADHGHEHGREVVVLDEVAEHEQQRGDEQDEERQPLGETAICSTSGVVSVSTSASMPLMRPISVAPPSRPRRRALAARDQRAAEGHAGTVAQRASPPPAASLVHRHRLAGQDRFLDLQPVASAAAGPRAPCRRPRAARCRPAPAARPRPCALAVAQHDGARRQHPADGVHRLLGLALLDEADDGVDEHHGEDHAGVDPVIEQAVMTAAPSST